MGMCPYQWLLDVLVSSEAYARLDRTASVACVSTLISCSACGGWARDTRSLTQSEAVIDAGALWAVDLRDGRGRGSTG